LNYSYLVVVSLLLSCTNTKKESEVEVAANAHNENQEVVLTDSLIQEDSLMQKANIELVDSLKQKASIELEDSLIPVVKKKEIDFQQISKTLILPPELVEISGLSYDNKSNQILAVNDEKGYLYVLDPENGKVVNKVKFGRKGDYEGIELVDSLVYVLKSNGDLYQFHIDDSNQKADYINTPLNLTNDVEGLCYFDSEHALILACKGSPNLKHHPKQKKVKAFYSFDLASQTLDTIPLFTIADKQLKDFVENKLDLKNLPSYKVKEYTSRAAKLSPSAISWNKSENSFYILSSVGRLLVVVDRNGNIKHVEFLDRNIHYQPEGITFTDSGKLFISNEGRKLTAKIFIY